MSLTMSEKLVAIGVAPTWLIVASFGFMGYLDESYMKFFLASNVLALVYTSVVLRMWIKRKLMKHQA